MRCKTCEYPLWQLTDRKCPECGTPFLPSEHEFILNSVRFCCPHCEQAYYGTGEKGHLVPREFACVKCAKVIDMDEMVLLPAEGVSEQQTQVTVVPWVERRERNWFTAFFVTMGMAIGNPNRTIDAVPEASSAWRAFWYMAIHLLAQVTLSGMPFLFGMFFMLATVSTGRGSPFGFVGGFAICAVGMPIVILLAALVVHGFLRITGKTAGGFGRTMHAICYSSGNNFLMGVPCLGGYFLWFPAVVWWTISAGFMLRRAQNVRPWRAVIAVMLPLMLVIGCAVGGVVAVFFGVQRSVSTAMASMPGMPSTSSGLDLAAARMAKILDGSGERGGAAIGPQRPRHPAELLMGYRYQAGDFILPGSASDTAACKVRDETLNAYQMPFGSGAGSLSGKLLADPAAGSSVCRVGDFVFTYGDIPKEKESAELWLAIAWPDPELNSSDPTEVGIVRSGGVSEVVKEADFGELLVRQNELRASGGMGAIPHPRSVLASNSAPLTLSPSRAVGAGGWPGMPMPDAVAERTRIETIAAAMLGAPQPLRHAAELLVKDRMQADEFLSFSTGDAEDRSARKRRVRIGNRTLEELDTDSETIKGYAVSSAIALLPADALAYRIGDTVFTHLGVAMDDPKVIASDLWIVVGCPERVRSTSRAGFDVVVASVNAKTRVFKSEKLSEELGKQNELRKTFGLPPIPTPQSVIDGVPALREKTGPDDQPGARGP